MIYPRSTLDTRVVTARYANYALWPRGTATNVRYAYSLHSCAVIISIRVEQTLVDSCRQANAVLLFGSEKRHRRGWPLCLTPLEAVLFLSAFSSPLYILVLWLMGLTLHASFIVTSIDITLF